MRRTLAVLALITLPLASACSSSDVAPAPNPAEPTSQAPADVDADPTTVEGACAILVGPEALVDVVLSFPDERDVEQDADLRETTQQELFEIVAADLPDLSDPAGELVDYLDDPEAYAPEDLTAAVDTIRTTCA